MKANPAHLPIDHVPAGHEHALPIVYAVRLTTVSIQCPCGAYDTVPKTWQFISEMIIES